MQVFTAQQMRDFDRAATEKYGIPSIVLMENAALRVVEFLEMKFAPLRHKNIVVLCGKGNNGGDGLAIARHLLSLYENLYVVVAADPTGLKGDAAVNRDILLHLLGDYTGSDVYKDVETELDQINRADIVIDALLGTGFHGAITDNRLIQALNGLKSAKAIRIAVDIPSALNSDTGEAAPEAVPAQYTVTFAAPKAGLFLRDGVNLCGEVWVGDIGTGSKAIEQVDTGCQCIAQAYAHSLLPERPIDAHKGDAGRVVLCGGSYGMSGAPTLAARASLSVGAGLCIACLPDKILPLFATAFSEATSHALPCNDAGQLIEAAADAMPGYWKEAHVVGLGPGLSRAEGALNFARRVMRECPHPLLIDADALYAVRSAQADLENREAPTILTPHPGEMGELMEMKTADVQADRLGTAQECAKKYNAIVVLKGARSVVALPNGCTFINLTGNSGMATGGSGDVLTGTICGLLAQLKDAEQATLLGVYLHGLAGDIAHRTKGNGLIAGDIAENLPHALIELQKQPEQPTNSRLMKLQ
ncbi:MAG: NAD(P)H-hydrate dehydratase [Abitibacteriaceae bacterium]|nr:NAD(P)H-hydrate dehydratase [Abditibacteriaceae bacterium]MBV9864870.1 NAD(P)H-hydrate dehydratase [Abditibacteriaceae bacterium]